MQDHAKRDDFCTKPQGKVMITTNKCAASCQQACSKLIVKTFVGKFNASYFTNYTRKTVQPVQG